MFLLAVENMDSSLWFCTPCSGAQPGGLPFGKTRRWHKAGSVGAFLSIECRTVILKCLLLFRHPSLVLGRAMLEP